MVDRKLVGNVVQLNDIDGTDLKGRAEEGRAGIKSMGGKREEKKRIACQNHI